MSRPFDPIPRPALIWLLVSQWLCIAPLIDYLPVWLLLLAAAVTLWRWQIHRGIWSYPNRWIKALIVLSIPVGLVFSFDNRLGMEVMLSLLVAGFTLKLVELRQWADLQWLVYLGYFVAGTQLLFVETILGTFYGGLCFAMMTGTLLVANQRAGSYRLERTLKTLGALLLQALPLMLLLFLVIPRMGSFWTVPLNNSAAKTGVSDEMAPGDFSNLMRSGELAFRATFEGAVPRPQQLYWRALVLSDFDGRRWRSNPRHSIDRMHFTYTEAEWKGETEALSEPIRYQVMLEPTQKEWLYALPAITGVGDDFLVSPGFTLYQHRPVAQRIQYQVESVLDYRLQARGLSPQERAEALALPEGFNPETLQVASRWRAEAAGDEALMQRLLTHFRERFYYTLQPPLLGVNSVDEFLWKTQSGFCEHFSSSFVFFMRAAGIPARVVVGYQGGRLNPVENYLTIRQYDAHAWSEVWLPARGWVRVDPTAAVAPERIEQGVEFSLDAADSLLLGNAFSRRFAFVGRWQLQWEALNYRWHGWVMGYNTESQKSLLKNWLGDAKPWKVALVTVAIGAGFMLLMFGWSLWRQRKPPRPAVDRLFLRFLSKLAGGGVYPRPGESVRHLAERAAESLPASKEAILTICQLYERISFAGETEALPALAQAVNRFRAGKARQ